MFVLTVIMLVVVLVIVLTIIVYVLEIGWINLDVKTAYAKKIKRYKQRKGGRIGIQRLQSRKNKQRKREPEAAEVRRQQNRQSEAA